MEKAKTRSRAKAVPSDAPTGDKQPDQPVLPPPSLPVPGIEATPAKKPRKTKKKKNDEATTTMAEAAPMAPPPVAEVPPTTSQQQQPAEASQTAETKKRGKRLKATEIVAQIEQQEHPEESAIVSMLMEESTKLEETPAKKAKKGGPGRKGRKKQEQQPPLETPIEQPVVVEEPKTAVVVEQVPPPSSAIKKTKKRGRKPAAAAAAPEQKEEEAVVQVEVAVAAEQPSTVTAEAPVVVQESAAGATLLQVPSPIHTRTRTRTRTNTNPVPLTRPALNTTQDLPNKEPSPATVDQTHPQSDADAVKSHHDEQSSGESKTMSQDEAGNGQAKSKVGGARIVRPKETVTVVKTAVVNAETSVPVEVEKKVVEIVRREAGPRIVKPPEAIIQEQLLAEKKRKLLEQNDHVNKVVKKLKEKAETAAAKKAEKLAAAAAAATAASSTVVVPVAETNEPKPETKKETAPDFKSIHQKEASKMESIVDFQKRLHKRHMTLNGADATANKTAATAGTTMATSVRGGGGESNMAAKVRSPSQSAVSRMPKPVVVTKETPNKQNKHEEPVVKVTKKLTMPSPLKVNNNNNNNVLSTQSSNIPVFISKPTKETKQVETKSDAKTPKPYVRRPKTSTADNVENVMAAMSKTPRAAKVMTASSVLAPKTPVNQTGKPVGQENLLRSAQKNGQASQQGTGTTIPPQLATSSFIRRKSFDLNASLSRRLAYKPYIGKLKPIETAKPAATGATAVCLSTTRHNLNCTKYN